MIIDENKVYSLEDVAQLRKVHPNTIRSYLRMGILTGTQTSDSTEENPQWFFTKKDIEELEKNLEQHDREKMAAWKASFNIKK